MLDEKNYQDQNNRVIALNMALQLKGTDAQAPSTVEDVLKWAKDFYEFITKETEKE